MFWDNLDAVRDDVFSNDGVICALMAELRDAYHAGKLGVNVVENISKGLASRGLGHSPRKLPTDQGCSVLIFGLGSTVADIVNAVAEPSEKGAALLRSVTKSDDAEIVKKIKELVCD